MRITLAVFAVGVALFLPGTAAAIPPGNDTFASATSIGILPFNDALSLDGATTEPGEPQACNFQQQSVWYSVTPAAPTAIRIDVNGSDFGVVANLWRGFGGGLGGLGFQGCLGFGGNITLAAEAGATYYIQAGSVGIGPASLSLNVQQVPPPANDAFADSKTVGSLPYVDFVDMLAATVEPGEQTNPPGVFATFQGSAWYAFTAPTSTSMLVTELGCCAQTGVGIYTGNSLGSLAHVPATRAFGRSVFQATAGTTYMIQLGRGVVFGSSASLGIRVEETPAPSVTVFLNPFDPSSFDTIQFFGSGFDPAAIGIDSWSWDFGDGATGTGQVASHRYAADGDYEVMLVVRTPDGRSASSTRVVNVRTHDVAITKLQVPQSANVGQTRQVNVGLSNKRYGETAQVQLFKSGPGGFELVGTLTQSVPIRGGGRTTDFQFSYTFTSADEALGKVTFKAVASLVGARDALPADNEAVALPTRVNG